MQVFPNYQAGMSVPTWFSKFQLNACLRTLMFPGNKRTDHDLYTIFIFMY